MSIENIVEKAELLDCYGMLLTARQRECLDLYYNENLTLAEIAEYFHISRQAVHDAMRHGEEQLAGYENHCWKRTLISKWLRSSSPMSVKRRWVKKYSAA